MAQEQPTLTQDGQEIALEDFNESAKVGALADDRTFADLLRLAPYDGTTVAKAVIPFAVSDGQVAQSLAHTGLVQGRTFATGVVGGVFVRPFRVIIGSRTTLAADPISQPFPPSYPSLDNWRDIRSAVFAPHTLTTSTVNPTGTPGQHYLGQAVTFSANPTVNKRWDRIVAKVTVDTLTTATTTVVKPVPVGTAAPTSIPLLTNTTVVLQVVPGTAAGSPVPPATPSDDLVNGIFYVPLADVLIADGFDPTINIPTGPTIHVIAPVVPLSTATGAVSSRPASFASTNPNVGDSFYQTWASSGRPVHALPSTMTGAVSILAPVDISVAPADAGIIDARIDWRFRVFQCRVLGLDVSGACFFVWEPGANPTTNNLPNANGLQVSLSRGQSFVIDDNHIFAGMLSGPGRGGAVVMKIDHTNCPTFLASNKECGFYVDMTTGALKLYSSNTGGAVLKFLVEVTASGQMDNVA